MARDLDVAGSQKKWMVWAGRIASALVVLPLLPSGIAKVAQLQDVVKAFVEKFGYQASALVIIGVLELTCVVLYVIPRTAVLGAILITGYMGGAVATHVRIGDPSFFSPLLLGVLVWVGLYLRDPQIRALIPLRRA